MTDTVRLTTAQALVRFLAQQHSERDVDAGTGAINREVSTLGWTQRACAEHVTAERAQRDYL